MGLLRERELQLQYQLAGIEQQLAQVQHQYLALLHLKRWVSLLKFQVEYELEQSRRVEKKPKTSDQATQTSCEAYDTMESEWTPYIDQATQTPSEPMEWMSSTESPKMMDCE